MLDALAARRYMLLIAGGLRREAIVRRWPLLSSACEKHLQERVRVTGYLAKPTCHNTSTPARP
jgi:hypothetical protein